LEIRSEQNIAKQLPEAAFGVEWLPFLQGQEKELPAYSWLRKAGNKKAKKIEWRRHATKDQPVL
jgi:hypothetical protein